ncbi:hypothetical protein WICPIJ_002873 [Wickerhamomyces pijperi]|uniref:WKF domain-containing protein n=1 Tax=Wickerhamomyces pijperi TaxID=599730 RepID=A0A9P8TPF8_WICPI|nr:hypothetical protein WICPIJ_002873 [Wickerhamomyces pijperi]
MSEHIPAWKRIGLKVQEELHNDPLALTEHLESGKVTNKQAKQLNKRKRAAATETGKEDGSTEKKPPKRVKVAKSEKPPPPEKDQLVYLKAYTDDLSNWKFSKQKQNWILKHIRVIEDQYEQYLVNYLVGLQGGSRDRLVEELKKVMESWNTAQLEYKKKLLEPKDRVERAEEAQKEEEQKASKELDAITKSKKNKQPPAKKKTEEVESVDADYALRARKIVLAITEEQITLEGIDNAEEETKEEPTAAVVEEEEKEESKEEEEEEEKATESKEDDTIKSELETKKEKKSAKKEKKEKKEKKKSKKD